MENLQRIFQRGGLRGAGGGGAPVDQSVADTSETTHISSLALLKMLKHGRAGVPMEVMGLMLGEFIDDYTVQVVDVFAMPQSGTGVSVEAVDPVFQTKMLDMLKQTNRPQMVVGWYHSHPGFGCWLSGVDINCFPISDHQILTEHGFFYYHDVMNYFKTHSILGIASYVDGNLLWSSITANDVSYHSGKHNMVNMKGSTNNVSIRPTDNHQMWVRAGPIGKKGERLGTPEHDQFSFYDAKQLVTMGKTDSRTSIRFSAQFEEGVVGVDAIGLSLPFAVALGLESKIQIDAFLWLYGYFLGNGWLDGSPHSAYILFGPMKLRDCDELDQQLSLVGLPRLSTETVAVHGYWKAAGPNCNDQTIYRICSDRWCEYFAGQYSDTATEANPLPDKIVTAVTNTSVALEDAAGGMYYGDIPKMEPASLANEIGNNTNCFWSWYKLLSKEQLRALLSGLCLANGHSSASPHPVISTSSARFRDEIQMVALMAGYAADWEMNHEKHINASNVHGEDLAATNSGWRVRFHEYSREAQPRISASSLTVDKEEQGAVWCVTVPAPHLIMVRQILKKENDHIILASRPVITGNTQQSFEALNKRAVAVVIDPIQSVKGKVVIDAFRLINPQLMMLAAAPRQTTSNLGHLRKPSIQALIHNLNRHYYSINIAYAYRKNEGEQRMLLNLHKKTWTHGLSITHTEQHHTGNISILNEMLTLCSEYVKRLDEEQGKTEKELLVENVGKIDPKKHLAAKVEELMTNNISQTLGIMIDTIVF